MADLAYLQVPGAEVHEDVEEVDEIHEVVQAEPDGQGLHGDLSEGEAEDDDPEVVEEGQRHHHGPVVAQPAGRVKHEGPVASGAIEKC